MSLFATIHPFDHCILVAVALAATITAYQTFYRYLALTFFWIHKYI